MADTTALKNRIRAAIRANDNQEITGPMLQQSLLDIVDELNGATETEANARQSGDSTLQQNITAEKNRAEGVESTLQQDINAEAAARQQEDTRLNNLITGIKNNIDNGYVYAGIATPSTAPASGKVFYFALTAGIYTNFDNLTVTRGINILKYNGSAWSLDAFISIDDKPIAESKSLVESGGVYDALKPYSEISKQELSQLEEDEIDFSNNNGEVVASIKSNGDFECHTIKTENLDHEIVETQLEEDEIDFLNDDDEVVAKLDDSGDFECHTIKTENLDHEIVETQSTLLGEEIFSDDEESEEYAKIGSYGIKAKKYLNLDGTPLIPEDDGFICLTDIIYTFVGSEVCIYADAIIKSIDRGLMSPMNYKVIWNCEIGIVSDRFYKLDPQAGDVGNHTLHVRVYDMNNNIVMDKTITIVVLSITSFSSQKNILFVGDSLGADTATQIINRIDGLGGTFPNFVGSQGSVSGRKYEARGGWKFADYAGVGRPQYRVVVSGVTSLSRGSVYSDGNNNTYTIAETNIDASGDGNIAMTFSSGAPVPSGILTKVSGTGDATISVVSATSEGGNPLWNTNTNQLDIANYRSLIGLSGKIDIVIFQLLVNDAGYQMPVNLVKSEIESLYSAFMADNQNTVILISLGTTWGNTISGTRTNGGANFDTTIPEKFMWEYRKMLLSDFGNNASYPNIRISCVGSQLDRYYGYELGTYQTSKYVSERYTAHINYVHPGTIGYQQLAEAWVSELLSLN